MNRKEKIIQALHAYINKRPMLDPRDYITDWRDSEGRATYRAEARKITKDLHQARELLQAVSWRTITADDLIKASKSAFSGRLDIIEDGDTVKISYCVGQYFPTEYRKAVCSVLASALWTYWRTQCMPEATYAQPENAEARYNGMTAKDYLRNTACREFTRSVARVWFN